MTNQKKYLLTITEKGFFKISPTDEIKVQNRGGSGIKICSTGEKTGNLAATIVVEKLEGSVLVATSGGIGITFPINTVRQMSRTASGVKAINLKDGEKVVSLNVV